MRLLEDSLYIWYSDFIEVTLLLLEDLHELFDNLYPTLKEKLLVIKNEKASDGNYKRTEREILEAILQNIRAFDLIQSHTLYEMYHEEYIKIELKFNI